MSESLNTIGEIMSAEAAIGGEGQPDFRRLPLLYPGIRDKSGCYVSSEDKRMGLIGAFALDGDLARGTVFCTAAAEYGITTPDINVELDIGLDQLHGMRLDESAYLDFMNAQGDGSHQSFLRQPEPVRLISGVQVVLNTGDDDGRLKRQLIFSEELEHKSFEIRSRLIDADAKTENDKKFRHYLTSGSQERMNRLTLAIARSLLPQGSAYL